MPKFMIVTSASDALTSLIRVRDDALHMLKGEVDTDAMQQSLFRTDY